MKITSVLLGSAAALVVATGAQAADLPGEAVPAAVDYVKVCDTFGAGFFYIPGTETCLDISGRVRFGVTYSSVDPGEDVATAFADGRVDFDAKTATEYGALRSFFRIKATDAAGTVIDKAFLQLGYATAGYFADFYDGFGGLYGESDRNKFGSTDLGVSVLVDDIAGGFYVGAQILAAGDDGADGPLKATFGDDTLEVQGIIGIASQPWGSLALAAAYNDLDETITAKLGGEFKATEQLSIAGTVAYVDDPEDLFFGVGASYAATDTLTAYANFGYDILDGADAWGVTVGADYTVVSGLVLTTEVTYDDTGASDTLAGLVRLTRTW